MSQYVVTDAELISVANAIRTKGGTQAQLEWPSGFISAINAIPTGGGVNIVDWATGSDADIAAMIDAAQAGTIDLQQDGGWAVGDVRTISIQAFQGVYVNHDAQQLELVITSFDEYENSGNILQFDFRDLILREDYMNNSNSNEGGYGSSKMKTTIIPALVNALPEWLKTRLIEFSVPALNNGGSSASVITVTGNKLALRSVSEVFGSTWMAVPGDGTQLSYYQTTANRTKKYGNTGGVWWTRTPYINNSSYLAIKTDGSVTDYTCTSTYVRICAFGCL